MVYAPPRDEFYTRPLGVSLLALVFALLGVVIFLFGVVFLTVPLFLPEAQPWMVRLFGLLFVVWAVFQFFLSYGLWNGRRWAWWMALALSGLSAVLGLTAPPVSLTSTALSLLVIYYLTRSHVKEFFDVTPRIEVPSQ
ncbi:MAG TPA: hypothetical protein ENG27_02080, partial [Candidatus Bathyarchaeota archaeon]|nr:hypothetical protein [Candidatus Bathyarchaeota archaeon]